MILQNELLGIRPSLRWSPLERNPGQVGPSRSRSSGAGRKRRSRKPLNDDTGDALDNRPAGHAVGWIRESLGMDAPPCDPFDAPRPKRKRQPEPAAQAPEPPPPECEPAPAEPEAAAPMLAAEVTRARGRAYDLDFRDQPGEDLEIAPANAGVRAGLPVRGPP
jgi:hypothetical protein